ncbi:hypothetical protein BT96DRAFT_950224 [Gymnopus androsaceus JB14]|uniref:Uncharacterized protein n=1 Tax=Gymnopus androsaceus JB14 TaxID=1447944 RepID=A0A6A4GH25_9AGAR|nr:hypothetical protein BT96DRAFT_950224 [Gymnopus androsaceus JB14]
MPNATVFDNALSIAGNWIHPFTTQLDSSFCAHRSVGFILLSVQSHFTKCIYPPLDILASKTLVPMPNSSSYSASSPELDLQCWHILRQYAGSNSINLPKVKEQLLNIFKDSIYEYNDSKWRPYLSRIVGIEPDTEDHIPIIAEIEEKIDYMVSAVYTTQASSPPPSLPLPPHPAASNVLEMELDMDSVLQSPSLPLPPHPAASNVLDMELDMDSVSQSPPVASFTPEPAAPGSSSFSPSGNSPRSLLSTQMSGKAKITLKEYTERKKQDKGYAAKRAQDYSPMKVDPPLSAIHDFLDLSTYLYATPAPPASAIPVAQDPQVPASSPCHPEVDLEAVTQDSPDSSTYLHATPAPPAPPTSAIPEAQEPQVPASSPRLCSFDGHVGAAFTQLGIFVTTPNMDVVHAPIGRCEMRMRRQNNFAKDDPLYWPQPYHYTVGHLAVIPYPNNSVDHPLHWAWYQPTSGDFKSVNVPGLAGTVCLAPTLEVEMVKLSRTVLETISKLTEEQQCDGHLWLQRWVPRLKNVDFLFALDCDIMGAFMSDLGIAADLFRVGIPLWLVCPLQQQPLAQIDHLVAPLDEEWSEKLRLRSLDTVDVSHERPPHLLIYVGLPGSFKRYARMAIFIHRQFAVSLVGTFGSGESTTPSGSLIPLGSVARSSATSSSLSSAVQTKLSEMESLDVTLHDWIAPPPPKPKAPPKKKQKLANPSSYVPPPTEPRNCFLPIIHDSWPIRLHVWDIASVSLLMMWLHICPALLWRLGLPNAKLFTNKQWRAMLEAADGFCTTPSQPLRAKMLTQLKSVLEDSRSVGIQIDAENIASVPALWNGVKVNLNTSLDVASLMLNIPIVIVERFAKYYNKNLPLKKIQRKNIW